MSDTDRDVGLGRSRTVLLLALFLISGAAALIYEVLWLKELGRLFGVTAHAAATTLAVFFIGLSAGSFVWGRRAARIRNTLRTYALLELGIAASALLYFLLLDLYRLINAPLFTAIGYQPLAVLLVKFLLSALILFPPAFFMGGTLPVMAQFLIRRSDQLGRRASALYALNTVGAAAGALLAGFYLPRALGFRGSYLLAIGLNLTIALVTFVWSMRRGQSVPADAKAKGGAPPVSGAVTTEPVPAGLIWTTAFVSGLITLGLEVLWTRMFAQVLQNSIYTFSVILTIFLTSLGLGSALASALCRRHWSPRLVLFALLAVSGLLVGLTPLVFYRSTSGLQFLGEGLGWTAYVATVFARVALVLTLPTVIMGTIFPYLLKLSEGRMTSAGRTIGQLASLNTLAAILGSLAAGFLLLEVWGLWASLRAMAIVYLGLAVFAAPGTWRSRPVLRAAPLLGIALFAFLLTYRDFATVHLDEEHQERLVQVYEGSAGTVAVIHRDEGLGIKVNNHYVVGTSGAALNVRIQSFLPLSLHPAPRSVFYLGMGTGITAGGALPLPVERVTVCELSGDVVRASREHFGPFVYGLHEDSRVRILAEDGRTYLGATDERFDLVIGDIFLTHRVGVGSLYTLEHFETVRDRLQPGGYFVQWLPMFELSREEFGIIARTMLEVFPQLTLWRRGFSPSYPVYALLGQTEPAVLDRAVLGRHFDLLAEKNALPREIWIQGIPLAAYAGNIGSARALFEHHPISTDDRTPLEYLAPIRERNARGPGTTSVLAWTHLAAFCDSLLGRVPPREDPYLVGLDQPERRQIHAGLAFYRFETHRRLEQPREADAYLREYQRLLGEEGSAAN